MVDPVMAPEATVGSPTVPPEATVLLRDLHVTYRVYEDRRPQFRQILANRFRRPSYREINAVRGVDLVAYQGEAVGLVGNNGSGKSTLLQSMAGLLPPTSGEVYASSQPSLLGVSAALRPGASGRRNIILGGLALGLKREEVDAKLGDVVAFAGLEDFIDLPIRTYSSGMRARLHFAIATSIEPEILLIDEALSVGDEVFRERSKQRIQQLQDNAGTVFLVSHSLATIPDMCNRCLWMHQGELRMDGEPGKVIKAYKSFMKEAGKSA